MPEVNQAPTKPSAVRTSRRWWWVAAFVGWTIFAVVLVWWMINDTGKAQNTLIQVGPDVAKPWTVRLRETAALARINSPWALAWILLAPYALWIGIRFSFEISQWRSRLAMLLVAGVSFIAASQWLSERLGSGHAMIVMLSYSAEATVEKSPSPGRHLEDSMPTGAAPARVATNHIARVTVSSSAASSAQDASWEVATDEILSGLPTNLPPIVADRLVDLPRRVPPRTVRWSAALDGLAYIALIGLAHAGVFHRRYREREQQAVALASRLNEARLHALQAQLQPHFLFNTLNGIATLLRRDPAKAEDMLLSLSDLLRIALNSSARQEIPLREEMDFLGRYLAIQKMRFGDRIEVVEEMEPAAMDCLVPALLLQPLVENAIRHGLEPSGQPGKLRITGSREGHWLRLAVEDNGVGLPSGDSHRAGVGLANVRERLTTLHGAAHEFSIANRPEGGVVVSIRLPIRMPVESSSGKGSVAV